MNRKGAAPTLASSDVIAFLATTDSEKSKSFYRDVLGLKLTVDEPWALVFDANGTMLRIQKTRELAPQPFTVLGFRVADIAAKVSDLHRQGVAFEHFSWMPDPESDIWTSPNNAKVAWFKDPDGNLLSLTEFPSPARLADETGSV